MAGGGVKQGMDLDQAVNPTCLNSLLNIWSQDSFSLQEQHKVDWIRPAYAQQEPKRSMRSNGLEKRLLMHECKESLQESLFHVNRLQSKMQADV